MRFLGKLHSCRVGIYEQNSSVGEMQSPAETGITKRLQHGVSSSPYVQRIKGDREPDRCIDLVPVVCGRQTTAELVPMTSVVCGVNCVLWHRNVAFPWSFKKFRKILALLLWVVSNESTVDYYD